MDDDEMKNLELVEALMNRASGIETKEEGDKLDRLILSGEISTEDIDEANKEVEIIRSLLPLVNEDAEAKFPEYAKERMFTKIKEVFPDSTNVKKEGSSLSGLFGFLKPVLTFSIVVAIGYFVYINAPKPTQNFAAISSDKFDIEFAIFDLNKINSSEESQSRGLGVSANENIKIVTDPNFDSNTSLLFEELYDNDNQSLLIDEKSLKEWVSSENNIPKSNPKSNADKPVVKILYDSLNLEMVVKISTANGIIAEKSFPINDNFDLTFENMKIFVAESIK
ncbi:MAG: hypothetical protein HOG97_09125 [Candidatus Marinimicrobia bacterium]|jgi:hypothetical protein|nr:hypothetical protein [Candidatus Neomarinimicrobiota bacterium]